MYPQGLGGVFPALYPIIYSSKRVCIVYLVSSFHTDISFCHCVCRLWGQLLRMPRPWAEAAQGSSEEPKIHRTTPQIHWRLSGWTQSSYYWWTRTRYFQKPGNFFIKQFFFFLASSVNPRRTLTVQCNIQTGIASNVLILSQKSGNEAELSGESSRI